MFFARTEFLHLQNKVVHHPVAFLLQCHSKETNESTVHRN